MRLDGELFKKMDTGELDEETALKMLKMGNQDLLVYAWGLRYMLINDPSLFFIYKPSEEFDANKEFVKLSAEDIEEEYDARFIEAYMKDDNHLYLMQEWDE